MTESDPAEFPPLNEETPALDAAVAVEWWFEFEEDGGPKLDTFHGFHDAEKIADGDPPVVSDGEIVTATGIPVDSDGTLEEDSGDSRHLFLTHREALSRGIDPCTSCFPRYATDRRIERERGDDGLLTEPGVEGVVFKLSTRYDLESDWTVDSIHDTYTSMLYRARAVRKQVGSAGGRLRVSYVPIRRCGYSSFSEAMAAEPSMAHVSELRSIQPDELPEVRDRLGDDALRTQVVHEHRVTDTADTRPPIVHESESPPCGYERDSPLWGGEEDQETREMFEDVRPTVADVIEQGNVVRFCETCFPELASWDDGARDE